MQVFGWQKSFKEIINYNNDGELSTRNKYFDIKLDIMILFDTFIPGKELCTKFFFGLTEWKLNFLRDQTH